MIKQNSPGIFSVRTNNDRLFVFGVLIIALLALFLPAITRAGDIESAKQSLEKVKVDVDNSSWSSVEEDIKATEDFLDGVPDADKAPVQKELDDLKVKAAAGVKDMKSKTIISRTNTDLDRAADSMSITPQDALDVIGTALDRLNSDDAKKYVDPDQLKKLHDRAINLQTMATTKSADQKFDRANIIGKELDDKMATNPFKGLTEQTDIDHTTQDINALISRVRGAIEGIPATDPRVKTINDKLAGYTKQVTDANGNADAAQKAQALANYYKSQQEYFAGWDQEKQAPTWDDYNHKQSAEMSDLLMPKTAIVLSRMVPWFNEDNVKNTAAQYKDDPTVKATLADAHEITDAAAAKLNAAFNGVMDGAEKIDTPKDPYTRDKAGILADRADYWFKGTQYHDQDVARAKAVVAKWKTAVEGAAAAQQQTLKTLITQADAAWPAIAASITAEKGFTPDKLDAYKGKIIHLSGRNRLGWDFNPGSYQFAQDINGMPVAGKFTPTVAAAVDAAEKATGNGIDDEAKWDVYATVQGPGKIDRRTHTTGKVKVDGEDVGTVTSEGHSTEDCAVVQIFAVHAGPVAVGPSGSATSAGSSSPMASSSLTVEASSSILLVLKHLIEFAFCIVAAGLVAMKSRPALAGQLGTAGASVTTLAANPNIPLIGVALSVLGALWLLSSLIYRDLLPASALTISGIYIASDWLVAKILPPNLATTLKPLGIPIAAATAILGFLHIFIGAWPLF